MWAKHIINHFEGLFRGAGDFFETRDNLEIKKVKSSSKKP